MLVERVQDGARGGIELNPGLVRVVELHAPERQGLRSAAAHHGVVGARVVVEVVFLQLLDPGRVIRRQGVERGRQVLCFHSGRLAGDGIQNMWGAGGTQSQHRGLAQDGSPLQFTDIAQTVAVGRFQKYVGNHGGLCRRYLQAADALGFQGCVRALEQAPRAHGHEPAEDPGQRGQRKEETHKVVPAHDAGLERRARAAAVGA